MKKLTAVFLTMIFSAGVLSANSLLSDLAQVQQKAAQSKGSVSEKQAAVIQTKTAQQKELSKEEITTEFNKLYDSFMWALKNPNFKFSAKLINAGKMQERLTNYFIKNISDSDLFALHERNALNAKREKVEYLNIKANVIYENITNEKVEKYIKAAQEGNSVKAGMDALENDIAHYKNLHYKKYYQFNTLPVNEVIELLEGYSLIGCVDPEDKDRDLYVTEEESNLRTAVLIFIESFSGVL
ncbi:hypothetical protein Dip510_000410 [Elusimicrobium posterum]|uniref:hypothetical protein n=1 Tax=Elusimicrobium posterum TaxID=3116653 RepID=UPI003C7557D8